MHLQSWPLFGLSITTPRIAMRYVDDELAGALLELAVRVGVHAPDFMPFATPWTRLESPQMEREGLQFYWRNRSTLSPAKWSVPFAVFDDGELVGVQDVGATSFRTTRSVSTGSWLGIPYQGKGIGKEMRAAILHFAFDGLGALEAHTSAWHDNPSSQGVTRSLGYVENGTYLDDREGATTRHLRFVLSRDDWLTRRRDDITIEGLDPCRPMLGAD
jgi:RimJ/RimL family protein N-acetyltransferase